MGRCLTIKQLELLAAEQPGGAGNGASGKHVESCARCRERLEECRANLAFLEAARPVLLRLIGPETLAGVPTNGESECVSHDAADEEPLTAVEATPSLQASHEATLGQVAFEDGKEESLPAVEVTRSLALGAGKEESPRFALGADKEEAAAVPEAISSVAFEPEKDGFPLPANGDCVKESLTDVEETPSLALRASKEERSSYVPMRLPPSILGIAAVAVVVLITVTTVSIFAGNRSRVAQRELQRLQQALDDSKEADRLMAGFAADPSAAASELAKASPQVRSDVAETVARQLASSASSERIIGAMSGLLTNPEAFWKSVDGGPLWDNGEWLELARAKWADEDATLRQLIDKAASGTPRQKYVVLCLMGQHGHARADVVAACVRAAETESHPGVAAAARWAAGRLGKTLPPPAGGAFVPDDTSGLTFVRVPGTEAFRRGSDESDPDRRPDEAKPARGVTIAPLHIATTELTVAAIAPFVKDPANGDLFNPSDERFPIRDADLLLAATRIRDVTGRLLPETAKEVAANWLSYTAAQRYCRWLTERAKAAGIKRSYRLATEDEWEYACRAGSPKRFCFGDEADYLPLFANCNAATEAQLVARRMPNMFGLFDMHGGLWEWCDARYPAELVRDRNVPAEITRSLFVLRGGAFDSPAVRCRSAQRSYGDVREPGQYWGARIVMEPRP